MARHEQGLSVRKQAIVLLSGGLDSATTLYIAKRQRYDVHCLIFDYGQRHRREVGAARKIAQTARCPFDVEKIRLPWKGSVLLDKQKHLPQQRVSKYKIPTTYVPARNTIFLSFALSFAEALNADTIFIGANAIDYSGYPDCRPKYFRAFQEMANLATKRAVEGKKIHIRVPLIRLTKAQIIKRGLRLGVPYGATWSCYQGGVRPCGRCDSCQLRAKGFKEAGVDDPLLSPAFAGDHGLRL